jgi:hypothetical protein
MTRDEAIEKATKYFKAELVKDNCFSFRCAMTDKHIQVAEHYFEFAPPRRIPPKGTPVMTTDKERMYFSTGGTRRGDLVASCNYDGSELRVQLSDWIELQEVPK